MSREVRMSFDLFESAFGARRRSAVALAVATILSGLAATAHAADLPTGGEVVLGQGSIVTGSTATVIDQSSSKLAINWQSFDIGTGHEVTFNQPGRSAVALNRVVGNEVSVIDGALNANGQVFLVNSNGVLFNSGSQVTTAVLVASTLNI